MSETSILIGWATVMVTAHLVSLIIIYPRFRRFRSGILDSIAMAENSLLSDVKDLNRTELQQSQAGVGLLSLLIQEYPKARLMFLDEPNVKRSPNPIESVRPETGELPTKLDDYELLVTLEKVMRQFVLIRFSELAPNWWESRIPEDVRKQAELRAGQHSVSQIDILVYEFMSFADVGTIISTKENWDGLFKQVFGHFDFLADFKVLVEIRNLIAHARELSPEQRRAFAESAHRILDAIREQDQGKMAGTE